MEKKIKDYLAGKVLFSGYYGQQNTGDDAFCAISAWGAKHYWKTKETCFLSRQIPEFPFLGKPVLRERCFFRGQGLLETICHLAITPILVFSGGSIFHSSCYGFSTRKIIDIAQSLKRIKTGAIGVSLGPYKTSEDRKGVKDFISKFSFLVLRDMRSYEDACSMNLPYKPVLAFDLAGLLPQVFGFVKETVSTAKDKSILGVMLCHFEKYTNGDIENEKRREAFIADTLYKVSHEMPVTIRFFVFNGNKVYGDSALTKHIANTLSDKATIEIIPYSPAPGLMWQKINQCHAVFSVRLHGAIFACMAKTPFLMVEYHRKCTDFLDDIGYIDKWRIGDMEVSADYAASLLIDMLNRKAGDFSIDIDSLTRKAELNFVSVISAAR